jgi:gas vesicle protein
MAYEYDRFEREDGGGSFLMGLLAGTVLGAGLGMLFAPRAGSELRKQVGEQAGKLKSTAGGAYSNASERVTQIVDKGREAYDRARTGSDTGTMGNTGSSNYGSSNYGSSSTGSSSTGSSNTGSVSGSPYSTAGTENR